MLSVEIKLSNDKQVINRIKRIGQSFYNFDAAMRSVGSELKGYYSGQVFAEQGAVYGQKWRGLSNTKLPATFHGGKKEEPHESYFDWKKKHYPGRGILVRTGGMQKSFYFTATSNDVTIGNSSPHFVYHQSSATRYVIPRRQMIGVNSGVKSIVRQIIENDVRNKIKRGSL